MPVSYPNKAWTLYQYKDNLFMYEYIIISLYQFIACIDKTAYLYWNGPWCYEMEIFSALLTLCVGNSPVTSEFLSQRSVTWSFGVFFDLRLNKRLSEQLWGWWFEMPLHPLLHHCNGSIMWLIPNTCILSGVMPVILFLMAVIFPPVQNDKITGNIWWICRFYIHIVPHHESHILAPF